MTSVEKEILEFIRALNTCWTKGDPQKLSEYFHERMVAITPSDRDRREGRKACVEGWAEFARGATIHSWLEHDHKVQVFQDTAIVTYYYEISFSIKSQGMEFSGREMFTLIKENGRWWVVADQFSSCPE
ncbi:MAG: nuclear transport factor 2 family protein [Planctomycetota bacterium]